MTQQIRYVVLGPAGHVEDWRREHHLPQWRVIDAIRNPHLLFGLAGPLQLVALASLELVDARALATVGQRIDVLRGRGCFDQSAASETTTEVPVDRPA